MSYICLPGCSLKSCNWAIVILIITALAIFVHFLAMIYEGKDLVKDDFMNQEVFTLNGKTWSWWPISHFILYFILGFFFPQCFFLLMAIGVGFEIFEAIMGKIFISKKKTEAVVGVEYNENGWAGSVRDIVVNLLGFVAGAGIGYLCRSLNL